MTERDPPSQGVAREAQAGLIFHILYFAWYFAVPTHTDPRTQEIAGDAYRGVFYFSHFLQAGRPPAPPPAEICRNDVGSAPRARARARYGSRAARAGPRVPPTATRDACYIFLEIEQNTKTSHDRRQRHGDKVKEQSRVVTAHFGQWSRGKPRGKFYTVNTGVRYRTTLPNFTARKAVHIE